MQSHFDNYPESIPEFPVSNTPEVLTKEAWEEFTKTLKKQHPLVGQAEKNGKITSGFREYMVEKGLHNGSSPEEIQEARFDYAMMRSSVEPDIYLYVNDKGFDILQEKFDNNDKGILGGMPVIRSRWSKGIVVIQQGKAIFSQEIT